MFIKILTPNLSNLIMRIEHQCHHMRHTMAAQILDP
jgi:hypothetical protein